MRKEIHQKLSQSESDKSRLILNLENEQKKTRQLEGDKLLLQQQLKTQVEKFNLERTKLNETVRDTQAQFNKIFSRETQYQNEFRKRDTQYNQLKDQLKKLQGDKGLANAKPMKELTGKLQFSNGSGTPQNDAQQGFGQLSSEFTRQISVKYEEQMKILIDQNQMLVQSLQSIQREMNEMLAVRKEVFLRRKRIEMGQDYDENELSDIQLIPFKKELFQMGDTITKGALELLGENVRRFRESMEKLDSLQQPLDVDLSCADPDQEVDKIKALKQLRQLLGYYKQIIHSQDELLNKTIVRSNDFEIPSDFNLTTNRMTRLLDEKDIDSIKTYIKEQNKYLEEKHREIDVTKKVMVQVVNKIQEDKNALLKKRQEMELKSESFKENLRNFMNDIHNLSKLDLNAHEEQHR